MNFLLERHKNLIIALFLILLFILDFTLLMGPQIRILRKIGAKVLVLSSDLRKAKKDIASQKEFKDKLTLLKGKIEEIGASVKPEEELPSILDTISRTANRTSVKITQLKPLKEERTVVLKTGKTLFYQIPVLIDVRCGYHELGKFLNELERGDLFLKIIALEVTTNQDDILHHLVRLTIQLFVLGK
ncbi:MAG: type 4a pilus biogenesis protein PilO [Candidatus Omnitrophota bacterium]|nr:type 4a pilus biogenesis protein PilO [Candidatus Omnitrophota bacterium]